MLVAGDRNATLWPSPLTAGWSETLFARIPLCDALTRTVAGVHVGLVVALLQVFRTKAFSNPLLVLSTRFVASEEKAMNSPSPAVDVVELMLGCSLKALAGDTLSVASETSDVAGVQLTVRAPHVSRTKICWIPVEAPRTRFVAVEA